MEVSKEVVPVLFRHVESTHDLRTDGHYKYRNLQGRHLSGAERDFIAGQAHMRSWKGANLPLLIDALPDVFKSIEKPFPRKVKVGDAALIALRYLHLSVRMFNLRGRYGLTECDLSLIHI